MQPDPSDRQLTDVPEPKNFEEAMGHLARERQQHAHTNSELDKVRKEAAGYRTQNRGQLAVHARRIAGLLGEDVADGAEPPGFDDLVPKLESALKGDALKKLQGENRDLKIGKGLAEAFHRAGVKPSLTRAYLHETGGMERINKLDPDLDDFAENLDLHIGEAIENEPALRGQTSSPTRTSAPFRPGENDRPQFSRDDLAGMSPEEVASHLRSGRLDGILGRGGN